MLKPLAYFEAPVDMWHTSGTIKVWLRLDSVLMIRLKAGFGVGFYVEYRPALVPAGDWLS
jgi:hypothetical protein